MATCPVCQHNIVPGTISCPSCGYKLQEATQEFEPVAVPSRPTETPSDPKSTANLTVCYGKQEGVVFSFESGSASIGRAPQCDVFLNDMTVSRNHATLERINDAWTIRDNASFNGVWVNNKNVDFVVLHDGDLVQIGAFILRFTTSA